MDKRTQEIKASMDSSEAYDGEGYCPTCGQIGANVRYLVLLVEDLERRLTVAQEDTKP